MTMILFVTGSVISCTPCYNCECQNYVEVGGQIVDTTISHSEACGKDELDIYESEGCICTAK